MILLLSKALYREEVNEGGYKLIGITMELGSTTSKVKSIVKTCINRLNNTLASQVSVQRLPSKVSKKVSHSSQGGANNALSADSYRLALPGWLRPIFMTQWWWFSWPSVALFDKGLSKKYLRNRWKQHPSVLILNFTQ